MAAAPKRRIPSSTTTTSATVNYGGYAAWSGIARSTSTTKAPDPVLPPGEAKTYGTGKFKMKIAGPTWSSRQQTKSIHDILQEKRREREMAAIEEYNKKFDLSVIRRAVAELFNQPTSGQRTK